MIAHAAELPHRLPQTILYSSYLYFFFSAFRASRVLTGSATCTPGIVSPGELRPPEGFTQPGIRLFGDRCRIRIIVRGAEQGGTRHRNTHGLGSNGGSGERAEAGTFRLDG